MIAYENGSPAYFATPPVNLINAYHTSLRQLTKQSPSLEDRFKLHREASKRIKDVAKELGLKQIPVEPAFAANGMTTVRVEGFLQIQTKVNTLSRCIIQRA